MRSTRRDAALGGSRHRPGPAARRPRIPLVAGWLVMCGGIAFGQTQPMQIKLHKLSSQDAFGTTVPYARGYFPAETAFSTRMIPALVAEGFEWTIVDNIHFDRATRNYPHTDSSNLYAPNRADAVNPDPAASGGAWVQFNNLWAPSKVSAPFSYQPHNVQYVDPATGTMQRIVAVPGARYEGNEDGRGARRAGAARTRPRPASPWTVCSIRR